MTSHPDSRGCRKRAIATQSEPSACERPVLKMNVRRVTTIWLVFLALSNVRAASQGRPLTLAGELSEGQTFRKSIGHGLDFVLTPTPGWFTGWILGVSPQGRPSDPDCRDFVPVVTPPYRSYNARYLDTQYGISAQEAIAHSPREFFFVLNCTDFETESKRLDIVLWPYSYPQKVVDEAMAKLGSSSLGKGRLWIEDYKITPGRKTTNASDLGAIHWIKFKVEIKFPPGPPPHPKP
jgi:hypothetical protein